MWCSSIEAFVAEQIKPAVACRYVDDLVLFDDDVGKLKEAQHRLSDALAWLRLRWRDSKTRLVPARQGITFVGYRITNLGVRLPGQTISRFHLHLHALQREYGADGDLEHARSVVSGLIGHARQADEMSALEQVLEEHPLVKAEAPAIRCSVQQGSTEPGDRSPPKLTRRVTDSSAPPNAGL